MNDIGTGPEDIAPASDAPAPTGRPLVVATRIGRWILSHLSLPVTLAVLAAAFYLAVTSAADNPAPDTAPAAAGHAAHGAPVQAKSSPETKPEGQEEVWTCTMHPQIRRSGPGLCPICNMELVQVTSAVPAVPGARTVALSPAARQLAGIETVEVRLGEAVAQVRMVGRIDYDETRLKTISAWIAGRIESLHADFTGKKVEAGSPLVELYSPELLVAHKELLLAARAAAEEPADAATSVRRELLEAVRGKLRLFGLSQDQVRDMEAAPEPARTVTIHAPIGGTIVEKLASEGEYVEPGVELARVADLSVVWARLEAFESDLPWLRVGQTAILEVSSLSGERLSGIIRFVEPLVKPETRTAGIRVELQNPGERLKPGMFVRATVDAQLSGEYVVVPASALLLTGRRAVAYVEVPGQAQPTYEGRTVRLGQRAGDFYVVESGLEPGERVVARGAFKLDAELQIQARPSMLSVPSQDGPVLEDQTLLPAVGPAHQHGDMQ